MRMIYADARVTVQSFDEEHEEYVHTEMSVEEALDFATDEGCPPVVEAEPARQWISVEDRLPKIGKVVLAFGTRSASTGQFQGVGAKPWFWYWKGNTIRRVTHWMPLPELPEENDDEHL